MAMEAKDIYPYPLLWWVLVCFIWAGMNETGRTDPPYPHNALINVTISHHSNSTWKTFAASGSVANEEVELPDGAWNFSGQVKAGTSVGHRDQWIKMQLTHGFKDIHQCQGIAITSKASNQQKITLTDGNETWVPFEYAGWAMSVGSDKHTKTDNFTMWRMTPLVTEYYTEELEIKYADEGTGEELDGLQLLSVWAYGDDTEVKVEILIEAITAYGCKSPYAVPGVSAVESGDKVDILV